MAFHWIGKSADGNTITLKKLNHEMFSVAPYFTPEWFAQNPEKFRIGAAVDVETTGLDSTNDTIIEIGVRIFTFNPLNGEVIYLSSDYYNGLQDPGSPLTEEIKALTGITDDMLKDQRIDWSKVDTILAPCDIIIAHNASFDRPFVDKLSITSREKIWGCSFKQIDWNYFGYSTKKLDVLSIYHGFFTDAHRALNDADAIVYLLSLKNQKTQTPYLFDLINNARKSTILINAPYTPYEKKDMLKQRQYRWDPSNKLWQITIYKEQYETEIKWLESNIYQGSFRGNIAEISAINNFKKLI